MRDILSALRLGEMAEMLYLKASFNVWLRDIRQ